MMTAWPIQWKILWKVLVCVYLLSAMIFMELLEDRMGVFIFRLVIVATMWKLKTEKFTRHLAGVPSSDVIQMDRTSKFMRWV